MGVSQSHAHLHPPVSLSLPRITEPLNTVAIGAPLPQDATGLLTPLASLAAQIGPVSLFDDVLSDQQVRACMDLGGQVALASG